MSTCVYEEQGGMSENLFLLMYQTWAIHEANWEERLHGHKCTCNDLQPEGLCLLPSEST